MKKSILLVLAMLFMGATALEAQAPRRVATRLSGDAGRYALVASFPFLERWLGEQVVPDTLTFRVNWTPPAVPNRSTPITGFEWQFLVNGTTSGGVTAADSVLAGGTVGPNVRNISAQAAVVCGVNTVYTGRVRALGAWASEAPWGNSNPINFFCENAPPGPPIVTLDTLTTYNGGSG